MAKPEWGTKRICQSCGSRFYDFGRSPIICPNCGAVFDLEILNRTRRTRPASRAVAASTSDAPVGEDTEAEPDVELEEADDEVAAEEDEAVIETEDGEEDDSLIEDASELGDDEDMSDVIDSGRDEESR